MKAFRSIVSRPSIRSALFVMTFGAAPCAWGNFISGNEMMMSCRNTGLGELGEHVSRLAGCIGYLSGVVDSQEHLAIRRIEKSLFCIPEGTTAEQLRQVFLNYMTTRPQDWHSVASGLVINAFSKAWPCSQ